jgi:hypothetical protein
VRAESSCSSQASSTWFRSSRLCFGTKRYDDAFGLDSLSFRIRVQSPRSGQRLSPFGVTQRRALAPRMHPAEVLRHRENQRAIPKRFWARFRYQSRRKPRIAGQDSARKSGLDLACIDSTLEHDNNRIGRYSRD